MNNYEFEKAMERLEEIAHLLEQGNISLDQSLQLFDESRQLTELCLSKLDEAEKKLQILSKNGNSFQLSTEELD